MQSFGSNARSDTPIMTLQKMFMKIFMIHAINYSK